MSATRNDGDVNAFIASIGDADRRKESEVLLELMTYITDVQPSMWGDSIVGFVTYQYKHESGEEGEWFMVGFSPAQEIMTVQIIPDFDRFEELRSQLGKHQMDGSRICINKLADIDIDILSQMIGGSVGYMRRKYLN